ncbi:DUF2147 domain-containing protein [Aquabacterium sp.]|uniref:DUF2147 domain-containing protein n=1 Tax=Aquabacterium sp. TaxID=1872578 RepID=UPI002E367C26|nr:DUF2147 domain-containing protein [Aquabacterium sp.]HEX5310849.1 DUF2147 domain-containing protein [Aquabacterium sp.]
MNLRCLQRPLAVRALRASGLVSLSLLCASAWAAPTPQDAKGLWLSSDKGAIIEFKDCPDTAGALCGTIVWDKDAGTPLDTCGVLISKVKRYADEAWRDGWVFDPRSKKHYKAAIRVNKDSKPETLLLRAFIGTEILGDTEEMTRVASLPSGCKTR